MLTIFILILFMYVQHHRYDQYNSLQFVIIRPITVVITEGILVGESSLSPVDT